MVVEVNMTEEIKEETQSTVEEIETVDEEKIPVSHENAEEALLSIMIQDEDSAILIAQSGLKYDHFLKRKNRLLFPLILNVRLNKGTANFDMVADAAEKEILGDGRTTLETIGGLPELTKVLASTPRVIDLKVTQAYIDMILEQARLFKIKEIVTTIGSHRKFDESKLVEEISSLQQIISEANDVQHGLIPMNSLIMDAHTRFEDRRDHPDEYVGINTGFYWMDKYKAVAKRRTTIIGAKTSIGKSILASNIVTAMLKDGSRVLLFTPELDKQEYTDRIICAEANVPIDAWKLGAIEGIHAKRIAEANQRLLPNAGNLFIEDRGSQSAGFILNSVKKHLLNHQVDVVVVDYLQKLHYYGEAKKAITEMMDKFCAFAKDNNIAFILVSQLRRGEETEPTINMLKESGDLENFADCVILLHRNSITAPREKNKGWYMIAKNRQGPVTDRVEINFKDDCLKFEEVGQQTVTIDEDENDESGGFGGRK